MLYWDGVERLGSRRLADASLASEHLGGNEMAMRKMNGWTDG